MTENVSRDEQWQLVTRTAEGGIDATVTATNLESGEVFAQASIHSSSEDAVQIIREILQLAQRGPLPADAGLALVPPGSARRSTPWTHAEDRSLIQANSEGASIDDLARAHGRTPGAIRSRLGKITFRLGET